MAPPDDDRSTAVPLPDGNRAKHTLLPSRGVGGPCALLQRPRPTPMVDSGGPSSARRPPAPPRRRAPTAPRLHRTAATPAGATPGPPPPSVRHLHRIRRSSICRLHRVLRPPPAAPTTRGLHPEGKGRKHRGGSCGGAGGAVFFGW
jgi:hypothetical protein